jgi:hypothetical protein
MAGQLAYLVKASAWSHVRFGVLPGGAAPRVPLHGFTVYDQAAVTVETFTRELTLTDADEVASYEAIFAEYERAAVFGGQARALVEPSSTATS